MWNQSLIFNQFQIIAHIFSIYFLELAIIRRFLMKFL